MIKERLKSDSGLMGPTHALSAIAFTFLFTWLAGDFMFDKVLGTNDLIVFIAALIIIVGASLMPDLDAVQSTSINTLGFIGVFLSKVMRGFSSIVQETIRSKSDSSGADPHRGFWHTILSAFLIGFLTYSLTLINSELFKIGEKSVSVALFLIVFIIFISIQLFIASLIKPLQKKMKSSVTLKLGVTIGSLFLAILLVMLLPKDLNYNWVGAAVTFGWIAHLLGDMMTVAGVPVLFPLKFKGKRWWNFKFPLGIKAGGFIEMSILTPLFILIAIVSAINVIPMLN